MSNGLNGVTFGFVNRLPGTGPSVPPVDYFTLTTGRPINGSMTERVVTENIDVLRRNSVRDGELRYIVSTTLPSNLIRLNEAMNDDGTFLFSSSVSYLLDNGQRDTDSAWGYSTINSPRNVSIPEPSSLVLIGLAHLVWLPRLRKRWRERHVSG